jgi:hypothetical protein
MALPAVPAFIGRALQFFGQAAGVKGLFGGKKDDGLGDQENRKKLAARAFLEGYEPDSRLFAKGPVDDAPDIVVPQPLTQPVTNILPPQPPVVPQLVPAGAPLVAGEEDKFILQELNRIDSNIIAIAAAMQENAKSDAEYRAGVIEAQKEELARRGKSRSKRRQERAKSFRQQLADQVSTRTAGIRGRLKGAAGELGRGVLGYGALLGAGEIYKQREAIQEFMDSLPEQAKTLLKSLFGAPADDQGSETASTGELQESTSEQLGLNEFASAAVKLIRQSEGTVGETGANKFFSGKLATDLGYGDLETKTFNEVAQLQQKFLDQGYGQFFNPATQKMDRSAAVGVGQFLYPERDLKNYLDMDPETTLFTEENQIKLILAIAAKKRGVDLNKPLSIEDLKKLNEEWAGIASGKYKQNNRTLQSAIDAYKSILESIRTTPKAAKELSSFLVPTSFPTSVPRSIASNTQMLEPLIIDQSGYKVKEPPVTSTLGGSEQVPAPNPTPYNNPSPYLPLVFGKVT